MNKKHQTDKILFVGPLPPPIHGQSIAFQTIIMNLPVSSKFVVNQNFTGKPFPIKLLLFIISILKEFFIIKFASPKIVYFTCSRSNFGFLKDKILLSLINKKKQTRVITHLHGADFANFFNSSSVTLKRKIQKAYQKVDLAIVLTDKMRSQFNSVISDDKIRVIPNFYEHKIDTYTNLILDKIRNNRKKITLIYFSNIMQTKGIFFLLEAYQMLAQNNFNIELKIAGDFVSDKELSSKEVKIKFFRTIKEIPNLSFVGVLTGESKYKFLLESDIFILPTYYSAEAFPISIIESMRMGNAIITTDHNYLSDILGVQNGFITDPKSTHSIYRCLLSLLNDRKRLRKIQLHNHTEAGQKYSEKKYLASIEKLLL